MMRPKPAISRNVSIALAVVLLHIGFIWGLYSGLLMRAVELVVPVVVLSQFIDPPVPKLNTPPPPPPPPPPAQVKKTLAAPSVAATQPLAIADPTPSPNAPSGVTTPEQAPAPVTAPVAPLAAVPAAPPAALAVQLPSSNADYLQNPRPPYPPLSRRLNEQGKSMVRVLIGADGQPQRAEIAHSSGFARLDEAALATVMRWRYVPGKRGGVAETMWFNVPIHWVLE